MQPRLLNRLPFLALVTLCIATSGTLNAQGSFTDKAQSSAPSAKGAGSGPGSLHQPAQPTDPTLPPAREQKGGASRRQDSASTDTNGREGRLSVPTRIIDYGPDLARPFLGQPRAGKHPNTAAANNVAAGDSDHGNASRRNGAFVDAPTGRLSVPTRIIDYGPDFSRPGFQDPADARDASSSGHAAGISRSYSPAAGGGVADPRAVLTDPVQGAMLGSQGSGFRERQNSKQIDPGSRLVRLQDNSSDGYGFVDPLNGQMVDADSHAARLQGSLGSDSDGYGFVDPLNGQMVDADSHAARLQGSLVSDSDGYGLVDPRNSQMTDAGAHSAQVQGSLGSDSDGYGFVDPRNSQHVDLGDRFASMEFGSSNDDTAWLQDLLNGRQVSSAAIATIQASLPDSGGSQNGGQGGFLQDPQNGATPGDSDKEQGNLLSSPVTAVSASAGGIVPLVIDFDSSQADLRYALLATLDPASVFGHALRPTGGIQPDNLYRRMVSGRIPNWVMGARGNLNADGDALAAIMVPAGRLQNLVGQTVYLWAASFQAGERLPVAQTDVFALPIQP